MEVNRGCRLGWFVGVGVGKGSFVFKEVRRDLVVIIGVEVRLGVIVELVVMVGWVVMVG